MNVKRLDVLSLLVFLMMSGAVAAESFIKGPVFTDYGPVFKVADRDIPLKKNLNYKVIFDISKTSEDPEKYNRQLENVARYINMHALNGVALKDMDIAVVLHGKASRNVLTHEAFEERYVTENPSIDLIEQLSAKGVKFYLCGQSAYFSGIEKQELIKPVKLALSAMTMLTQLQDEGYHLLP
jgi:intracellular sulfur oxidation DsrE/DsrF family protein